MTSGVATLRAVGAQLSLQSTKLNHFLNLNRKETVIMIIIFMSLIFVRVVSG